MVISVYCLAFKVLSITSDRKTIDFCKKAPNTCECVYSTNIYFELGSWSP